MCSLIVLLPKDSSNGSFEKLNREIYKGLEKVLKRRSVVNVSFVCNGKITIDGECYMYSARNFASDQRSCLCDIKKCETL